MTNEQIQEAIDALEGKRKNAAIMIWEFCDEVKMGHFWAMMVCSNFTAATKELVDIFSPHCPLSADILADMIWEG